MNQADAVLELVVRPASVNGAATAYVVDTADYDYAEFEIDFGAGPTGAALTVLKVQESDVEASATSLTGGSDVPGTIFGTSYTLSAPSNAPCAAGGTAVAATGVYPETQQYPLQTLAAVVDNSIAVINVELKGRKRYLLLCLTTGEATLVSASVRLSRADVAPHLPAQMLPAAGGSAAAGNVLQCPPYCPTASGT